MTNSDIESVQSLIAGSEGPQVEFKSSMRWDYRASRVNKDLIKVVAKTIAAFMNSLGGTLLIGVDDEGAVIGLDADIATLSKQNHDGYELALRDALVHHLGAEIDSVIRVAIVALEDAHVAMVTCDAHPSPVFLSNDGHKEFWVRSGNATRSLDPAAAISYVQHHWSSPSQVPEERLRTVIEEALAKTRTATHSEPVDRPEQVPYWLRLSTRRVLDLFLYNLSRSHSWKRIFIISPWVSDINGPLASITLDQILRRLRDEGTTLYVVTRPPEHAWHEEALDRLAATGRANIALLPELHVKLFTAQTAESSFAMLGSANFTTRSLSNREIGVLVSATGDGKALVRDLEYEAAEIYRHPNRKLMCKARL